MLKYIAYPYFLYIGVPILTAISYWRWYYYKKPIYSYGSIEYLKNLTSPSYWPDRILFFLRFLTLAVLLLALSRPRIPDDKSKIPVKGIDIALVLDVSGSMQLFDDPKDPRSRIEVAKKEALKFIEKRENDPIALVVFGKMAVSRCPLTLDKNILKEIVKDTNIGIINPDGTVISQAILMAANRLKNSNSKSKIMIVLTDGEPSPEDVKPEISIDMAKKLGIKIYTIGVGSEQGGFVRHPYYGIMKAKSILNIRLLEKFANETGGQFFLAQSPSDMEKIYNAIDKLERSEHETPLFANYFEYFMPFLLLVLLFLLSEIVLSSTLWLSL